MQTETGSSDSAGAGVEEEQLPDREERRIAAIQRMYKRVLEDEQLTGVTTLKRIDAALRGQPADE